MKNSILIFILFLFNNGILFSSREHNDSIINEKDTVILKDTVLLKDTSFVADANYAKRDSIVKYAEKYIGTRYQYGSMNPAKGFDCSGFVNYVFLEFDIKLPRSSKDFPALTNSVDLKNCKKGDIMIFAGRDPRKRPVGHVGIVYENIDGNVKFIHSATTKKIGVIITDYNKTKYYNTRLVGIKNVLN